MSEAPDRESRTEEPSQRKLDEAENKGNVPFSRELPLFASILGILIACHLVLSDASLSATRILASIFDNAGTWRLDDVAASSHLLVGIALAAALAVLPILLVISAAGLAGSLLQNPPGIAAERIKPSLAKISLGKGWRRIFGWHGQIDFAKSTFKLIATSIAVGFAAAAAAPQIVQSMLTDATLLPATILSIAIRLTTAAAVTLTLLAAADLALSRFSWRRDLRMTRQELKDDVRQAEGDPFVKQRFRALARRKASRRMMAQVPKATLVVTNPTHISVAMRYIREDGGAPMVVAKGADHLALRIREVARKHNVPIMEDRDLARALHDKVEVGTMIPPEFYRAVAELIHVLNMKKTTTQLS